MGNFEFADSAYNTFLVLDRDIIRHLLRDANFAGAFVERWQELRQGVWSDEAIFGIFDTMADYMALPAAQDQARWPGVVEPFVLTNLNEPEPRTTTWDEAIERTRAWLSLRLEWLDASIPLFADAENAPLLIDFESASFWAIVPISGARNNGLVPESMANGEWPAETSRLDGARAVVLLIEKASGKSKEQIADENGWDLDTYHVPDTDDKDVAFLRHAGVVTGSKGLYNPNGTYTRVEFVAMIGRAAQNIFGAATTDAHTFTDVPRWASPYVAYAVGNGIAKGYEGRFRPNNGLTNQETIVFVSRAYQVWG
jgi:hypothetical protein